MDYLIPEDLRGETVYQGMLKFPKRAIGFDFLFGEMKEDPETGDQIEEFAIVFYYKNGREYKKWLTFEQIKDPITGKVRSDFDYNHFSNFIRDF